MDGSGAGGAGSAGAIETLDDAIRDDALAALRLEHADFHFAEEVAAAGDVDARRPRRVIRPADRPAAASTSMTKKRQKNLKAVANHGIAKFFNRKQ